MHIVENMESGNFTISLEVEFSVGELVYLRSDPDQHINTVVGYEIYPSGVLYALAKGSFHFTAVDVEIAREKNVVNFS
jgi:hypothetical protein